MFWSPVKDEGGSFNTRMLDELAAAWRQLESVSGATRLWLHCYHCDFDSKKNLIKLQCSDFKNSSFPLMTPPPSQSLK